ncbi:hypothetical protein MBRA1_003676 [Malassezia brasiliensis]|uniref:Amino acid transporter transmembrane domain-containing protein n=1 Tax=Malassezia brasiliensis TaxID=1821822 RepID=A0AAF0DX47_9BASI|nr:hypothetical protein MBRA1_003676 [Malassezia brasiliensis]
MPPPPDTRAAPPAHAPARPPLPMRSTAASKEAVYDLDSDSLSDSDALAMSSTHMVPDEAAWSWASAHAAPSRTSLDALSERVRSLSSALGDPDQLPDWLRRGAGVFEGTVNMANSILGAGIVGLPYSMRESGFVAGVVLLLGIALLTDWTIRLIVLNAKLSGRSTYIDIMEHCFGHHGKLAVSLFQFVFAFGGMCAFCVVVGDTIPNVLSSVFPAIRNTFLSNRQFVIVVCTMAISFPLSLYRNIENLSKASAVALVSMVFIIIAVVVRGPAMPAELKGDPSLRFTIVHPAKIIRSISVISFAFVCHHNSLLIYGSLKEPSMDKFKTITHYSTLIAAVAALSMSVAGYWSFEDKTLSNVLNNFPQTDTVVNIARFCFGLNMFTTLPLECFVCREVLETYFFRGEYERRRHIVLTTALVVSAMTVSLLTCDLGVVLEVTGGLSATALAFFFPSICYLKLSHSASQVNRAALYFAVPDDDEHGAPPPAADADDSVQADHIALPLRPGADAHQRGSQFKWWESTKLLSIACAIFGFVVLNISVITALVDFWSGRSGATHQC